jgi:hypothetical protein
MLMQACHHQRKPNEQQKAQGQHFDGWMPFHKIADGLGRMIICQRFVGALPRS